MDHRPSISSDAASVLSGSTVFSNSKETQLPAKAEVETPEIDATKQQRKSMRQRVRNVVADLGHPPTTKEDAKSGQTTKSHVDVGPASGTVLMGSATV
ncbi:hypothetical protein FSARC_8791 [Fusarium sarcochroum]|uniref:Uncharacterized protein n=1 Tax=Fusarium sarcochroum TaxID=1208366 RepID=A0A8H4TSB5_9HYPO|nr:hypothetical protein FSARC_8791 [Fusarium sarcochroum]